jgi:hypothetical protein
VRAATSRWAARVAAAVALAVGGFGLLVLMDFGPRPVGWSLLVLLGCALLWLVLDTVDAERPRWLPTLPPAADRVEESAPDQRIVAGHLSATDPGPALRDRLVALARSRDPDLADPELAALAAAPPRRLTPAEIDHYITRIEELRDRP